MTAWVTLADIGTAAGTLVLAGATFVAVRAAARSTRIAERTLLAGQRPVEGGQPSVTRFVLLPEAGSWRCDATRYWSLPAGKELRDFGFS
jgi:hypothetical protein